MSRSNYLSVAAIQLRPTESLGQSLANAEALIEQAADGGAQLVVLPENFAYLGRKDLADVGLQERNSNGAVRQFLTQQARRHGLWLVGGTVPIAGSDSTKPFARSLLINPLGDEAAAYDKLHLFDADVSADAAQQKKRYRESDDYRAGRDIVVVETELCWLGMTVCYDLRFAELFRQLCDAGAEVIVVPAAFTAATGQDHWELLLRARAVENQVFVVGANMVDREHPRRALWGGSMIIDPWGTVLSRVDDQPGLALAEIDLGRIAELRQQMPIGHHRRL